MPEFGGVPKMVGDVEHGSRRAVGFLRAANYRSRQELKNVCYLAYHSSSITRSIIGLSLIKLI